jgi:hypothetical protein
MQIEEANSIVYDVKSSCISSFIVPVAFALPERLLALQCPELSALHPPKRRLERPLAPREPPPPPTSRSQADNEIQEYRDEQQSGSSLQQPSSRRTVESAGNATPPKFEF